MTLLREIQAAATDTQIDISTLLRKAKVLAARLRNPEFEAWVDQELNGYESRKSVPAYRVLFVGAKGNMTDGWWTWNNADIMTSFLPEEYRDWGEKCYLDQPIATLAAFAKREAGTLRVPWPPELAVKYGSQGITNLQCIKAWQVVNTDSLIGVLDTVRNRLLDFVLKIEAEAPDAGEAEPNIAPISMERLRPIVINTFYGAIGNVAQNSDGSTQTANMGPSPEEMARLVKEMTDHLRELPLDDQQRSRAEAQIAAIKAELAGTPDV